MIARIAGFTFGLLLLAATVLRAHETTASSKWMLEVSYNNQTSYFEVPAGDAEGGAGLNIFDETDKGLPPRVTLQLSYKMADDPVPLRASLVFWRTQNDSL